MKTDSNNADEQKSAPAPGSQPPAPTLKKVKLAKDHRHGDVAYKAGEEIEVNEADEKWLRENKVV